MRLAILLYGRLAGHVIRENGNVWMEYEPEYAADPNATPLSLSMPLDQLSHTRRPVKAFLRGLLPDRPEVRDRWAASFGVRSGDTIGLVAKIGMDVAGGAMFVPDDQVENALSQPESIETVTDEQVAEHLRLLRTDQMAWYASDDEHWSLAGGQSKFALVKTADGHWGLPRGSAPSTHIVKPGISQIPAQALIEHLSMRALAILGEDVASTEYLRFDDEPAIVVKRFDRIRDASGAIVRVHTEDLTQAHAIVPERKYESDGGPGVGRIANTLRANAGEAAVIKFAHAIIANYLLAAPDAHAKNYSLLLAGRAVELAPLYDVASGLGGDLETGALRWRKTAMSIGGENRFGEVTGHQWAKFAAVAGLDSPQIIDDVKEMSAALPDAFAAAIDELPADTQGIDIAKNRVLPRLVSFAAHTRRQCDVVDRPGRTKTTFFDALEER